MGETHQKKPSLKHSNARSPPLRALLLSNPARQCHDPLMSTPTYTITQLTPDHAAQWQAMRIASIRDFPLGFLVTEDEAAAVPLDQLADRFLLGNDWGIFVGTTLIGFCNCRRQTLIRTKHRAEIGPFFISAPYHGTGAATQLMTTTIDRVRADGIEQLELYVDSTNTRAIRFYERMGFTCAAILPNMVKINGQSHDDLFYILPLTP